MRIFVSILPSYGYHYRVKVPQRVPVISVEKRGISVIEKSEVIFCTTLESLMDPHHIEIRKKYSTNNVCDLQLNNLCHFHKNVNPRIVRVQIRCRIRLAETMSIWAKSQGKHSLLL